MAALLSQYNITTCECFTFKSSSKYFSQVILQQVVAIDMHSALAEDRETVVCFFVFQEISDSPSIMQYPVIDLQVSLHRAQSASQ